MINTSGFAYAFSPQDGQAYFVLEAAFALPFSSLQTSTYAISQPLCITSAQTRSKAPPTTM